MIVADSTLYGTTYYGGSGAGTGTIFKVNSSGTGYSVMHSFNGGSDGSQPSGDLTLVGSTLYGTCEHGGSGDAGTIFKINTDGNGYSTLFTFTGGTANMGPVGGLTLIGSNFYGTTWRSGSYGLGNIFKINMDGTGYTDLYDFTGDADGEQPLGRLVTDGSFLYGVNTFGGGHGAGTLYKIGIDGPASACSTTFVAAVRKRRHQPFWVHFVLLRRRRRQLGQRHFSDQHGRHGLQRPILRLKSRYLRQRLWPPERQSALYRFNVLRNDRDGRRQQSGRCVCADHPRTLYPRPSRRWAIGLLGYAWRRRLWCVGG